MNNERNGAGQPTPTRQAGHTLLIVEDDADIREQMKWALASEFKVLEAKDKRTALALVRQKSPCLVLLDLGLPPAEESASEGLETLRAILQLEPATKVIVATGNSDRNVALSAIHAGAYDFIEKPVELSILKVIAQRAANVAALEREHQALQDRLAAQGLGDLIGNSARMQEIFGIIRRVATSDASVLITGESGTGKELAARAVHRMSGRNAGSFIPINCGAIPEQLLESELFGYEKGAFTGAYRKQKGKLEYASGGTLFLDEIGEMPLLLQVKLLRFLQDGVIERVGGRELITVETRVVAATNLDLDTATEHGRFRQDLFFRLGVVKIQMPPLRDRGDDVLLLAHAFLNRYRHTLDTQVKGLSDRAREALRAYGWPGNVRELENRLKRAVIMTTGTLIEPEDLEMPEERSVKPFVTLNEARERLEKEMIQSALLRSNGNISHAAEELGVSRQSIRDDIQKYGITVPRG